MIEAEILTTMIGTGTMDDPFRPDVPAGVDYPNGFSGTSTLLVPVEAPTEAHIAPCVTLWSQTKVVNNGPL